MALSKEISKVGQCYQYILDAEPLSDSMELSFMSPMIEPHSYIIIH